MSFLLNTWVYGEVVHADPAFARQALDDAFAEIKRYEGLLSRFLENSVISRINRDAAQSPVEVDGEIYDLLETCLQISEKTKGAFDITTAPLCDLWRSAAKRGSIPSDLEMRETLSRTGHRSLRLDSERSTISFLREGMGLDLGAVGKGYILDRAAQFLKDRGMMGGLLNAGGNIISWDPAGSRIGIRDPLDGDRILSTVFLKDEAVATSANDERFFRIQDRTYGHILDPRTGWPVEGNLRSVSMVAKSAMMADALSTAVFVLGEECGTLFEKGADVLSDEAKLRVGGFFGVREVQLARHTLHGHKVDVRVAHFETINEDRDLFTGDGLLDGAGDLFAEEHEA